MLASGGAVKRDICDSAVKEAGNRLRGGRLVSFPTETVYGLGANALDPEAAERIFAAKKRPHNDPLIVHICDQKNAERLWDVSEIELKVLRKLGQVFWPGPLTIVARKSDNVPSLICAGTEFVGVRMPNHAVALNLIRESGLCGIAAPSANTFGHISPTTADHVYDDLKDEDVMILHDPSQPSTAGGPNGVGVESTVIKVAAERNGQEENGSKVYVSMLRAGGVSLEAVRSVVSDCGEWNFDVCVHGFSESTSSTETEATVAPGQLLRHYAPKQKTFVTKQRSICSSAEVDSRSTLAQTSNVAVIDFGESLHSLREVCAFYTDLSPSGDVQQAAKNIYSQLRAAEIAVGVQAIILCWPGEGCEGLRFTLRDKMYRASEGKVCNVDQKSVWV